MTEHRTDPIRSAHQRGQQVDGVAEVDQHPALGLAAVPELGRQHPVGLPGSRQRERVTVADPGRGDLPDRSVTDQGGDLRGVVVIGPPHRHRQRQARGSRGGGDRFGITQPIAQHLLHEDVLARRQAPGDDLPVIGGRRAHDHPVHRGVGQERVEIVDGSQPEPLTRGPQPLGIRVPAGDQVHLRMSLRLTGVVGAVQVPEADTRDVDHDYDPLLPVVLIVIPAVIGRRQRTCGYLGVRHGVCSDPNHHRKLVR